MNERQVEGRATPRLGTLPDVGSGCRHDPHNSRRSRRGAKDTSMTKIRLTQLSCLMLLIAWYVGSALPASATPDPPPGYYASPAASASGRSARATGRHPRPRRSRELCPDRRPDRRRHADRRRNDRPLAPPICPAGRTAHRSLTAKGRSCRATWISTPSTVESQSAKVL